MKAGLQRFRDAGEHLVPLFHLSKSGQPSQPPCHKKKKGGNQSKRASPLALGALASRKLGPPPHLGLALCYTVSLASLEIGLGICPRRVGSNRFPKGVKMLASIQWIVVTKQNGAERFDKRNGAVPRAQII